MDQVVLACGPAGSGKSTHAATLESQGYLRLSFDREAWSWGYREHPIPDEAKDAVNRRLHAQLTHLVRAGRHVVVDMHFCSRAYRDDYRNLLAPLGVVPVVHYLNAPIGTMLLRLRRRSGSGPDDSIITTQRALTYLANFEKPTADEGPLRVIQAA